MIPAKNYETVPKFVKVMPRIVWPLFFLLDMVYLKAYDVINIIHVINISSRP